jgi:uncharacterized surface protein with fasciclin (FAS1) repeats
MGTIYDTIVSDVQLSTLVTAVKAAGLEDTLGTAGPFTVFAPTNDAFGKVAPDALKALLADKTKLASLLKSHVVAGKQNGAKLATQKDVQSLQGTKLMIDSTNGVTVNKAKVVQADIESDNGVIHTIDTVLTL